MSNTTDELRAQAASIAAGYFMATSGDCVALTNEIYKLIHRTQLESRIDELDKLRIVKKGLDWTAFVKVYADNRIEELKAALEKQA